MRGGAARVERTKRAGRLPTRNARPQGISASGGRQPPVIRQRARDEAEEAKRSRGLTPPLAESGQVAVLEQQQPDEERDGGVDERVPDDGGDVPGERPQV